MRPQFDLIRDGRILALASALALATAVSAAPATAQLTVGLKAGPTGASLTDLDESESRTGFAAGAFAQLGLSGSVFLQPELLYVSRRIDGVSQGSAIGLETDFADLGALVGYRLLPGGVSPFLYVGPVFSFETRCRVQIDPSPSTTDCPDFTFDTNSTQTFVALGGGLDLSLGLLVLSGDLRYHLGLSDAAKDQTSQWRSWAFMVGAGIGLGR